MTNSQDDGYITGELMAFELTDLLTRWTEQIQALAAEGHDLGPVVPSIHGLLVAAADRFVEGLPPAVLDGSDVAGQINKAIGEAMNQRMIDLYKAGLPHADAPAELADYLERAAAGLRGVA
jgi:hypothetical protein